MTVDSTLVDECKLAMRITTNSFDTQIARLLETAMLDMGVAGVEIPEGKDALVTQAAITYVLLNFGQPDDYDRLKRSYDEQKGQLTTCTGYTDWGGVDG